ALTAIQAAPAGPEFCATSSYWRPSRQRLQPYFPVPAVAVSGRRPIVDASYGSAPNMPPRTGGHRAVPGRLAPPVTAHIPGPAPPALPTRYRHGHREPTGRWVYPFVLARPPPPR